MIIKMYNKQFYDIRKCKTKSDSLQEYLLVTNIKCITMSHGVNEYVHKLVGPIFLTIM